jgi:hypothetical protein
MAMISFLFLLSTASGAFSIPIPENGFEFKGGAPATSGIFKAPGVFSISSNQGYGEETLHTRASLISLPTKRHSSIVQLILW